MKRITILGATGSIGTNTLNVISQHKDLYEVYALTANTNITLLKTLCIEHQPAFAVVLDENKAAELEKSLQGLNLDTKILLGVESLIEVAQSDEVDYVMAAIVGAAGLQPTLAAARAGKRVLLANKEALVMTGQLFIDEVNANNAELLPIDSEHNAIFQCFDKLQGKSLDDKGITRILLTGSGGPFLNKDVALLDDVTPDEACAHPNWVMGRKISVDSATMMNKGLELIEACWLFNTTPDKVDIIVHPQSIIHSMVEYQDGSVLAQLGQPDMRTPIAYSLAYPQRIESGVEKLDLFKTTDLSFVAPDFTRFPCLRLATEAMQAGGTAPAILNAANEVAVAAFLNKQIKFTDIAKLVELTLSNSTVTKQDSIESVLKADNLARQCCQENIQQNTNNIAKVNNA